MTIKPYTVEQRYCVVDINGCSIACIDEERARVLCDDLNRVLQVAHDEVAKSAGASVSADAVMCPQCGGGVWCGRCRELVT